MSWTRSSFGFPLFRQFPHQSGIVIPLVLDGHVSGAFYLVWWRLRRQPSPQSFQQPASASTYAPPKRDVQLARELSATGVPLSRRGIDDRKPQICAGKRAAPGGVALAMRYGGYPIGYSRQSSRIFSEQISRPGPPLGTR